MIRAMSELRARQVALARTSILDACAALVTERHHLDFSMKEVAERAGVSLRTVYNHFATREDLLDALGEQFNQRMNELGGAEAQEVHDLDGLVDAVRANHAVFDQLGGISDAFAQLPLADVGRDEQRAVRTRVLVELVAAEMPDVPERDAEVVGLLLRHLFSHRSWFWLTREYGLTTDEAAQAVTWAVRALVDTANRGDLPLGTEEP